MMTRLLSSLCLISSLLFAEAPAPPVVSASLAIDVFNRAFGHINVITGEYVDTPTDFITNGAEPISFQRNYFTRDGYPGSFWTFPKGSLHIEIPPGRDLSTFLLREPEGFEIQLSPNSDWGFHLVRAPKQWSAVLCATPGVLNTWAGVLSGQTDLTNYRATFDRDSYRFTIRTGSGERRSYTSWICAGQGAHDKVCRGRNRHTVHEAFFLTKRILPNGNRIIYAHDEEGRLTEIKTLNCTEKNVLSWVKIKRFAYDWPYDRLHLSSHLVVTTSDQRQATYQLGHLAFAKHEKCGLDLERTRSETIREVVLPGGLKESYTYNECDSNHREKNAYLKSVDRSDGRTLQIHLGGNSKRIARLAAPLGSTVDFTHTKELTIARTPSSRWEFFRDEQQRLSKIAVHDNSNLSFEEKLEWDGRQLSARHVTSDKHCINYQYTYDDRGNVLSEKCNDRETLYSYSTDGFNLPLSKEEGGVLTTYAYEPSTNLMVLREVSSKGALFSRETFAYDENAQLSLSTYEDGIQTTRTEIEARSEWPGFALPEWVSEYAADELLQRTHLHYNEHNEVVRRDLYDANDGLAYSLFFDYDEAGRVIYQTDALGQETYFTYDLHGNCIQEQLSSGLTLEHTYDCANHRICTARIAPDGEGRETRWHYNAMGHCIAHIDELSRETLSSVDSFGQVIKRSDPAIRTPDGWKHPVTAQRYNFLGHLEQVVDPEGGSAEMEYTAYGELILRRDPLGAEEKRSYTPEGHLRKVISPSGAVKFYQYNQLGQLLSDGDLRHEYQGKYRIRTHHPDGTTTFYTYDAAGRPTAETHENHHIQWCYDALGRKCSEQIGSSTKSWEYDLLGRITLERMGELSTEIAYDSSGNVISKNGEFSTYNLFGELTSVENALKQTTHIEYTPVDFEGQPVLQTITTDALGRKTRLLTDTQQRPIHFERPGEIIDTYYDLCGRKILERRNGRELRWDYDACGRLIAFHDPARTTRYRYDAAGRLTHTIKPSGAQLTSTYDDQDRVVTYSGPGFAYTYTYDANGFATYVADTHRVYNANGHLLEEQLSNGLTSTYSYDDQGRLAKIHLPDGSAISYTRDTNHITRIDRIIDDRIAYTHCYTATDDDGRPTLEELPLSRGALSRTFDAAGRILSIEHAEFSEISTYDPCGRLTTLETRDQRGTTCDHYSYNDLDELLDPYVAAALTYDTDGRVIAYNDCSFSYDGLDRLIRVTTPTDEISYTYDEQHRRLTKTLNGNTIRYLYLGHCEIGSVDSDGNFFELRVLGRGSGAEIGATIAVELDSIPYIAISDRRGSIRALLGRESYRYSSYGTHDSPASQPYLFSSKRHDSETDLIFFGRRYYCPALRQWLTPDPLGYAAGPDLYAYALNNPHSYLDLYGCEPEATLRYWGTDQESSAVFVPKFSYDFLPPDIWTSSTPDVGLISKTSETVGNLLRKPLTKPQWEIAGRDLPSYKRLVQIFLPGMFNNFASARQQAGYIAKITGSPCLFCTNPTHGPLDPISYVAARLGHEYPTIKALRNGIRTFLDHTDFELLIWTYSQGGHHCKLTLNSLSQEHRDRIHVRAFGTVALIQPGVDANTATNYVSKSDPWPHAVNPRLFSDNYCKQYNVVKMEASLSDIPDHGFWKKTNLNAIQSESPKIRGNFPKVE